MSKIKNKQNKSTTPETAADFKKQTTKKAEVKKGYNENNPVQKQGAFKPDSQA